MKKSKVAKLFAIVLSFVMIIACLAACGSQEKAPSGSGSESAGAEFFIGASGPLTGGAAIYGVAVQNAAQLAVEEINAKGGINGMMLKFEIKDDAHDATKVKTNYANLMKEGMQVGLGCVTSAPCAEWVNYSNEDNCFFITPSASNDDIVKYPNGYQMCFADGNQGTYAAGYVNDNFKGQTIGVLYKSDDNYSTGIMDTFKANLDPSITLIETTFTETTQTTFDSQIQQVKDCKFVFMPIYYTPASLFMTQAKSIMAKDVVFFGCDGFDGIDSLEGFDINAIPQEVSMLSHFNSKAESGVEKEFADKYIAKYGADTMNQFGASAYDCVYVIAAAIEATGVDATTSPADVCAAFEEYFQTAVFRGVTGGGQDISWDEQGYVSKTAVKYIIKSAD